ncbi:N-formylglutamate deformylase [Ideonella sp. DXS22W]|uniref:N-formylglutamate deformylase n=1 Tax=Pseudaquabacterium inlustre TaxID=2984192 RepID=A0ABU9CM54_9BURK
MFPPAEPVFRLHRGSAPLLLSLPHVGTQLPAALLPRLVPRARRVEDTDWHLERLYAFAQELGASVLVPRYSRIVVDLNRPPENVPMYPGANNTELCPTRFFTGDTIYQSGQAPDETEVRQRVDAYWRPYHQALSDELARLKAAHGHAVLFDGHSIKDRLPWLFEGKLWDLNLGTADGRACAPGLQAAAQAVLAGQQRFTHITNGRFKGGHITRHYGQPGQGVHALQLEMCWGCYMDDDTAEPPFAYREDRAAEVQPVLRQLLGALVAWRPEV